MTSPSSPISVTPPPADDPWYYGYRFVRRKQPNGKVILEQVPLTLEDVLHPQEFDHISVSHRHTLEVLYLTPVFRSRMAGLHQGLVLADVRVDWGRPEVGCHSPDLAVYADVARPPHPDAGTFYLKRSGGGRCVLVLEVVSPHTRKNDVKEKLREYQQVGVPFYVIIDQEKHTGPRQLVAYEHTPGGFVPVPLTVQGRVELAPLGLCLGMGEARVVCYDTVTGEEMGDWNQLLEARQLAEKQARDAEKQAREQAEARTAAEKEAKKAKKQVRKAEKEAEGARRRIQELEAELQRLRGETKA